MHVHAYLGPGIVRRWERLTAPHWIRLNGMSAFRMLTVAGLALIGLHAQTTPRPQFEAASIKPHLASDGPVRVSMAGEHGSIRYVNVTVRACVRKAYGLRVFPPPQPGDPLSTERFDIIAKASGDASEEHTRLMLQTLLEERFKLVVHRETKELPVFALVVGKKGPKFRQVKDDGSGAEIAGGDGHQIKAHHISMKLLAGALQGYVGDPVLDETGLTGIYDLNLDFTVDENISAEGPRIFEAVQDQLGLKLEARKGPVEVIVIDHIEKPSAN
jgi:uncharacterized protein (TIGR03435 family)